MRNLLCAIALPFLLIASAYGYTWKSGQIILPNGQIAKAGEVVGWGFISYRSEVLSLDSFYEQIHSGSISPGVGMSYIPPQYTASVDYCIYREESDESGEVNMGSGSSNPSSGGGMWALINYICKCDGYEYYMPVKGICTPNGSPRVIHTEYLANYTTSVWVKGYALPEEPSKYLTLDVGRRGCRRYEGVNCDIMSEKSVTQGEPSSRSSETGGLRTLRSSS